MKTAAQIVHFDADTLTLDREDVNVLLIALPAIAKRDASGLLPIVVQRGAQMSGDQLERLRLMIAGQRAFLDKESAAVSVNVAFGDKDAYWLVRGILLGE